MNGRGERKTRLMSSLRFLAFHSGAVFHCAAAAAAAIDRTKTRAEKSCTVLFVDAHSSAFQFHMHTHKCVFMAYFHRCLIGSMDFFWCFYPVCAGMPQ